MFKNHGDRFRPLRIGQRGTPSKWLNSMVVNRGDPNHVSKSWEPILQLDPWGNTAGHSFVGNLPTYPFARLWWKILLWHHGMLHSGRTPFSHSSFPGDSFVDFHESHCFWVSGRSNRYVLPRYWRIPGFVNNSWHNIWAMKNPGCFWGIEGLLLPSYAEIIS